MRNYGDFQDRVTAIGKVHAPGVYLPNNATSALALFGREAVIESFVPWGDAAALVIHGDGIDAVDWNPEDSRHQGFSHRSGRLPSSQVLPW